MPTASHGRSSKPTARSCLPPVLTLPTIVPVDATSPTGASVDYSSLVSATDEDGPVAISCTPSSGVVFPIGDATVACTAIDAVGNQSTGSFRVHVKGATEQVADLRSSTATNSATSDRACGTNFTHGAAVRGRG